MPEPWEIDLQQIRQLQRNEVANHNRIRERVIHLRDLYYEGLVNDQEETWEKWAIDRFANSPENLRRILRDHPNTLDGFARRQQRRDEDEARHQQRLEDEKRKFRQAEELRQARELAAKEKQKATAKPKKPKPVPIDTNAVPPHQLMLPLIESSGIITRRDRVELGKIFADAKRLVQTHQVGKDPRNGKFWAWGTYCPTYFTYTTEGARKCIKAYEEHIAAGNLVDQDENVVPLRGGK
jgi:hypothetical protein